jgi:hypothetical protein
LAIQFLFSGRILGKTTDFFESHCFYSQISKFIRKKYSFIRKLAGFIRKKPPFIRKIAGLFAKNHHLFANWKLSAVFSSKKGEALCSSSKSSI